MTTPSTLLHQFVGKQTVPAITYKDAAGETKSLECRDVDAWFSHVSERMAYALADHPHGKGAGNHADGQMNRGQHITTNDMYYVANERGRCHPAYLGTPETRFFPKAGDRILMGQLSPDSRQRNMQIRRSVAGEDFKKYEIQTPPWDEEGNPPENPLDCVLVEKDCPINECYVDHGAEIAAFPEFDLYATMISPCKCNLTYQLACVKGADQMHLARSGPFFLGVPNTQAFGANAYWLVWAELKGDVPPNSFLEILADQIVK